MEIFIIVLILAVGGVWWYMNRGDQTAESTFGVHSPTVPPASVEPAKAADPVVEIKAEEPAKPKRTRKPREVKVETKPVKAKAAKAPATKAPRGRRPASKKA